MPIRFFLPDETPIHPPRDHSLLYVGIPPGEIVVAADLDGRRVKKTVDVRAGETTTVAFE